MMPYLGRLLSLLRGSCPSHNGKGNGPSNVDEWIQWFPAMTDLTNGTRDANIRSNGQASE